MFVLELFYIFLSFKFILHKYFDIFGILDHRVLKELHCLPYEIISTVPPQLAIHEKLEQEGGAPLGFPGLLKGSKKLGVALIADRGYCRNLAQKYAKLGILSPKEWCEANEVAFLWPYTDDDDVGLIYDPVEHRICVVPKDQTKVDCVAFI